MSAAGYRPWFISLTAKWQESRTFELFESAIRKAMEGRILPYFHKKIPPPALHSTVVAIAEFSVFPPHGPAEEYLQSAFKALATRDVCQKISSHFEPFSVIAKQLRCWDRGTVVQFADSPDVKAMREAFVKELKEPVELLGRGRNGFRPMLNDSSKSVGGAFFGSWARSVHSTDTNQLRWETDLDDEPALTFDSIYLLVSDDALTNRHSEANSVRLA